MTDDARLARRLRMLTLATALCYAIGYPVALGAHSNVGWLFVALGGPFLIALVVTIIQRVHLSETASRSGLDDTRQ